HCFRRTREALWHASLWPFLPPVGRPSGSRGPDPRSFSSALPPPQAVSARGQVSYLAISYRSELAPQRDPVAATASLGATGIRRVGSGRGDCHGKLVFTARRAPLPPSGTSGAGEHRPSSGRRIGKAPANRYAATPISRVVLRRGRRRNEDEPQGSQESSLPGPQSAPGQSVILPS